MKLLNIIAFMLLACILYGQNKIELPNNALKNSFTFTLGFGYEDGMKSVSKIPVLGFSYNYLIKKRWAFSVHLLSYYRSLGDDNYLISSVSTPLFDKIRGLEGLFLTEKEKENLNNSGIKQLNSFNIIKILSIPMDIGFTYYPLSKKHHRIGINGAYSLTYENFNTSRELFAGKMKFTDGSEQDLFLPLSTEFRNLSSGLSLKISYEYIFNQNAVGVRWGNYNVLFADVFTLNLPVWETSIFTSFKF